MENSWQSKCSFPWHSTTQQRGSQNQVEMNANNYFHPYVRQELRSSENGFVRDPMFDTSTSGSCRSGKPELGNSFLALLSGPSPHLQSGTHQVSSSRSSITSGKRPMHNSSIIFNGESCGLPVASVGLLSQHQVNSNMRNGIEQCSAAPSRAASISICSRASSLHDIQMADLTHGTNINKPALCPLVQGNETGPGASSPHWGWLVGSGSAASGPHNASNIQASKKAPSTTGSTLPEPTSTFTRGCLRVFCLATGGDLLISNTGLIGVVCSCHGLQMSIAKFCEHSGLCAINPGNAVLLESGETVAQWRRLYFHKSGIRIPDDNSGWDWPDDFPATGVLVNTTMQNTSMKSSMFQLTDPSVALARSGDHCNNLGSLRNCNVGVNMLEKAFNAQQRSAPEGFNVHSTTAGGILHPQLDDQRMKTVVENSIFNGLALSRSPLENSGDDSCYQSITDYIDFLTKGGNPLISNQSLGKLNFHSTDSDFNRRNSSRDALIMEKSATSSNIELRLGQPSQQGHTLDTSVVPAMQPQPFSVIGNCLKSQLQDPVFHNLVNPRVAEEPRQNLRHVLSDTSSSRRPNMNQLNFTHLASRGCNITESPKVEHLKADVLRSTQISTVLSHLVTSETNVQSRAHSNMANYNKSFMSRVLHGESHSTNGLSSFPRSRTGRMELNINELDHLNNVDKGKGTENFADNDSLSKANSLFHNKQMAGRIPLTGVVNGNSLPITGTAHEKQSFYRFQSPGTPAVASGVSNLSSQFDNTTSPGSSTYLDHALLRSTNSSIVTAGLGFPSPSVSTSFSSSSPIWRPNAMPNLSNKETIGLNPQFLDENLRLLALKHMVDLSKHEHSKAYRGANQDSNSYREINQEQQRVYSPTPIEVQRTGSSLDPLSCQQQNERSYRTTLQDAPTTQQHQTFSYCYMDRATEKSADVAGVNNWCNVSVPSQGISFRAKEHYLHRSPSHDLRTDRQPLPRIGRIENKITASCEHETGSKEEPRSYPGKCSCAVHSVHLAENCVTGGQGHIDDCKAHVGSNADCTELQGSVFDDGSVVQGDKTVALGHCQNMKRQLPKQNGCHASQWRDVPSKKSGVCNALSIERPVSVFDVKANTTDQYVQTIPKQLNGSQEAESLNEQQMSNVCSGISAPAVTEVMAEVNNMDSCTVEAGGARYVRDNIIDEESGIQKCCSSDNALESERSTETVNASRKLDLIEGSSSSGIPMLPVHGSIDNHRIPNSHGLKKNVQGNIKSELRAGKKKKAIKWKSLDASFPVADLSSLARDCPSTRGTEFHPRLSRGTQTPRQPSHVLSKTLGSYSTQSAGLKRKRSALSSPKTSLRKRNLHELDDHYREWVDDLHILSEDNINHPKVSKLSGEKKSKWHRTPDMSRLEQGQEANQVHAGKNAEHSVDYVKNFFSNQAGTSDKKKRPVVCGKSGVISTGKSTEGRQKPAKIVSLSKILNTARRRSTFENEAKTCFRSDKCIDKPSASEEGRGDENYDSILENELKAGSSSSKMKKTRFNRKEICITELCMLNTEKDVGDKMLKDNILQKYSSAPLKSRFKEARKRSLSELEVKGKNLSSMKLRCKETSKLQTKFRSNGKPYEKQVSGSKCYGGEQSQVSAKKSVKERTCQAFVLDPDAFCGVCGSSNKDEINSLLECNSCSIRVHQACYGVSRVPRGRWCCRPCKAYSKNIVCVLCGYGGGAMTRALRSRNIVKSLLKVWNVAKESNSRSYVPPCETSRNALKILESYSLGIEVTLVPGMMPIANQSPAAASIRISHNERDDTNGSVGDLEVNNTITAGVFDPTIKQWVHMVCGLWTPGTRCPNVDTMSTFDVSGASCPPKTVVCSLCNRPGGSRIQCRVVDCSVHFHPWCAHQKGLLQSEVEGVDNEKVGFYGRCMLHATYYGGDCVVHPMDNKLDTLGRGEYTCARTEGYKGRKKDGFRRNIIQISGDNSGCLFPQEQINAWLHINGQRACRRAFVKPLVSDVEYNYRMEYARYKQAKGWKHLVVYKSGIHALGLYTSQYICRGAMVVEYVGEIVGLRVADKREVEYESGKKLPYKGACYFFRIDKEHIIDATRKGGIARFVNHSCLPNCVAKIISVRNEKKVVFFAERDINPGEEITYDYHFNNEDEGKKIPCFCNSKNCRRYLN